MRPFSQQHSVQSFAPQIRAVREARDPSAVITHAVRITCIRRGTPFGVAEQLVTDCYQSITITEAQYAGFAARVEAAFDERLAARSTELTKPAATRRRLQDESDRILAAHFADAIDLDTLKRHQDRIRAGIADIDRRINHEHDQNEGSRMQIAAELKPTHVESSRTSSIVDLLRTYSNSQGSEIPVLSLISDATRCKTPTGNRNKKNLQHRTRRLSDTEVAELVAAYQQGDSVYALGRRFGIHRTTVSEHLKRAGVPTRGVKQRTLTAEQIAEVQRLREARMSIARIATAIGTTEYTVRRELAAG